MNDTDAFVAAISEIESQNQPLIWGDDGDACGPFQCHPSFYASYGPNPEDFGGRERSWAWAFEQAVRWFYADCLVDKISPADSAVAYHLHGQPIIKDDDPVYRAKFVAAYRKA